MLTRHLEKQLEESRAEVERLRCRVELLLDESQRAARDNAALNHSLSRQVVHLLLQQHIPDTVQASPSTRYSHMHSFYNGAFNT